MLVKKSPVSLSHRHCSQQHVEEVGLKRQDREHGANSKVPQRRCTQGLHYSSRDGWLPFTRAVYTTAGLDWWFGGHLLRLPKYPQELPDSFHVFKDYFCLCVCVSV